MVHKWGCRQCPTSVKRYLNCQKYMDLHPVPDYWLDPAVPLVYGIITFFVTALLTWLLINVWPSFLKCIRNVDR